MVSQGALVSSTSVAAACWKRENGCGQQTSGFRSYVLSGCPGRPVADIGRITERTRHHPGG